MKLRSRIATKRKRTRKAVHKQAQTEKVKEYAAENEEASEIDLLIGYDLFGWDFLCLLCGRCSC
jgi:hypothetical protein